MKEGRKGMSPDPRSSFGDIRQKSHSELSSKMFNDPLTKLKFSLNFVESMQKFYII